MPATHLSLFYHIIFTTKGRRSCIRESWEKRLYEYLGGTIRNLSGIAVEIGGTSDHVHILASFKGKYSLSEIIRDMKANSSKWIRRNIDNGFWGWQDGYGAITVSNRDIESVRRYIKGQKEHHRKKSFKDEYIKILQQCGIEYDDRYLW
jgi:REP element-mobilizing transposase RayT